MEEQEWKGGSLKFQQPGERGWWLDQDGDAEIDEQWVCSGGGLNGFACWIRCGGEKGEQSRIIYLI